MSQNLKSFCLACCFFALTPVLAVNPQLQVSTSGWSGQVVTVSVHNLNTFAVSGRVRISVQLTDGTFAKLTSPDFTAAAGSTISLTISASQPLLEVEDNPEPFGIIELS
jgi:hypothetical protein